ncbi:TPA: CRISPR-associated helicase Cas3', partial [Pseudomonas aeruginosa]|nr:CRISPR-associated helicase Cas3' [Pseudomonas aeruginosa]
WGVNDVELTQTAYPRLLLADGRGVRSKACQARSLPRILLREVTEALPGIAEQALQALSHGGCGVVIVNTVDRAQRLYRLLQAQVGEETRLLLFHARFPEDQRGRLEGQVLDCFGKEGQRPERALLVATQVAEQSLDIDFDFMFTDLAPVDLLLQRAGRLHRHAHRLRPEAHAEARLYVAGLNPQRFPELKATAWEYVYDPYILGRTWALLSLRDHLRLPEDIDLLVQAVYDEEVQLPAEITERDRHFIEVEAYGKRLGERRTERMMATNVAIAVEDEPQLAYTQRNRGYQEGEEGLGLPNYTRLGDESVSLVPVYRREGGWSLSAGGELFDPAHRVSDDLALALASRQIKTSRKDLVKHLLATEVPRAFVEHPLLRQLRPLELIEGQAVIGRLTVVLDEELGLVFIRDPKE